MRGTKRRLKSTLWTRWGLQPKVVFGNVGEADDPHLIALFRNLTAAEPASEAEIADRISPEPTDADDHDSLAVAKGVALGLLISVALWAAIGLAVWYLL
jgi:hypothetical protein